MNKVISIIAPSLLCIQALFAQPDPVDPKFSETDVELKTLASLPKILQEASGVEMTSSGLLWTHNDDRYSIIYGLDSLGSIVKTIHLNHPNHGWEDLTLDSRGNLYIGAFGNNNNDRKDLSILKIGNPDKLGHHIVNADVIQYVYSDQHAFPPEDKHKNYDADAFVSIGDSLFIFTKNRTQPFTGYTRVYRLPSAPGKYEAMLHDSIYLGTGPMIEHWVTSADVSADGKWLALLSHDRLWLISDFKGKSFSQGKMIKISLGNFSHKTGLCFASSAKLYIVDELEFGFLGGKLYVLDLGSISEVMLQKKIKSP